MRKLIAAFSFLFLSALMFGQTATVSGHVITGQNTASSSGISVLFELTNDGGQQCKVGGTGLVMPMTATFTQAQLAAGVSLLRNDQIACGTTLGGTRWRYTIKSGGTGTRQCSINVVGATNLDSTVCLNATATPVTTTPTDSVYARIDGTNAGFTGDITHNGHNDTGIGTSTAGQINKSIWVDGTKYPVTQVGVQAAFTDACAISGGPGPGTDVYLPPMSVTLSNSSGQQFLITCNLHIHGAGDYATQFVVAGGVASTVPEFRFQPNNVAAQSDILIEGIEVVGNTSGGDAFFFDGTNTGMTGPNNFVIRKTRVHALSAGAWAVNGSGNVSGLTQNGWNIIENNTFLHGINLGPTWAVDSWLILHNVFGSDVGNTTPCVNGSTSNNGASHITLLNNNGGCNGGFFISHGTHECKILYNQIEQPGTSVEANSAIIDLIGDTFSIDQCEIRGNNTGSNNFATNGIRLGTATGTIIKGNTIGVKSATGVGVVLTASSSGTIMDASNTFVGTGGGAVAVTNATGVNPFTVTLPNHTGLLPATILNDTIGGIQLLTNGGKSWDFQNTSNLVTPAGVGISYAGGTSGSTATAAEGAAGGTFTMLDINSGSVAKAQLTADFTLAANTNLQTIGALTFTTLANAQNLSFHCSLIYQQATAAVLDAFGFQIATNAPTNAEASLQVYTSATLSAIGIVLGLNTTTATTIGTFTPSATGANFTATIDGTVELPASAHTINFMASQSNSADLLTIKRGSYCNIF